MSVFKEKDLFSHKLKVYTKDLAFYVDLENLSYISSLNFDLKQQFYLLGEHFIVEFFYNGTWNSVCKEKISSMQIHLEIESYIKTRYLRLLFDKACFLEAMQVVTRKFKALLVAARNDGFGERMVSMLGAMCLAELDREYKFGFVWGQNAWDSVSLKQKDDNILAGVYVNDEKNIFEAEFIECYSYTHILKNHRGSSKLLSLTSLKAKPEEKWGFYVGPFNAPRILDVQKNKIDFRKLWENIAWSESIKEAIILAQDTKAKFKDFIAIHMRSGDIVFDNRNNGNIGGYYRAMPSEMAVEFIDRALLKNKKVILFSDDFTGIKKIQQYYSKDVYIIDDFIDKNLSGIRRVVYEIELMSYADDIIAGHSAFSRLASYIAFGKSSHWYQNYLSLQEQYNIVSKHLHKIDLHPMQKAYSSWFLYIVASKLDLDDVILYEYIKKCLASDEHPVYRAALLMYYLKNDFKKAQSYAQVYAFNEEFYYYFCYSPLYEKWFILLYEYAHKALIIQRLLQELHRYLLANINKAIIGVRLPSEFLKDYGAMTNKMSACYRVHNHLSYKLGQAMIIHSKTIVACMKMPYILYSIIKLHKQKQKEYKEQIAKNPVLKLPPLQTYADYQKALKEQQCFTYKLGQALIKAQGGGGGLLWFFYQVRSLRKEFKKRLKNGI